MFPVDLEDDEIPADPLPPSSGEVVDDEIPDAPSADPVQQLEPKVGAMARLIADTKAKDDASYLVVCEQTKAIKLLIAEVDATFDPLLADARQAVEDAKKSLEDRKAALERQRETKARHRGPLEQAEATNKAEIARFVDARDRAAKEAEAKRLAEQKRLEDAAAAKRADDISALADAGKTDEAAALAAKPLPQPVQTVTPKALAATAPKATGITTSKVAKATVTDLTALIIAIANKVEHPELAGPPLDLLAVGKAKLNAWATDRHKGPEVGANGIEITGATAAVTDMKTLVMFVAEFLRHYRGQEDGDPVRFLSFFEVVPSVLNKWTTAQGTALNWPGVTVEMETQVSASRRG